MDGVLNSMPNVAIRLALYDKYKNLLYNKLYGIDPDLVKNLKLILDRTNAKIVFSTSWRYFKDHPIVGVDWRKSLAEMLNVSQDIFLGDTPDISYCDGWQSGVTERGRGLEIKSWLENNTQPGKFKYCVIDDEICDIINVLPESNIVHTDMECGLQMKDVDRCVRILNE